jgi:hypothetical protein
LLRQALSLCLTFPSPSRIAPFGALLLGAVALAPSARAQSCDAETSVHSSYPADGATGVPTNAPVYVYGPALDADDTDVTLTDARGEAVMIDVTAAEGGLLIDAFLGYTPNTRYDLTVTPAGGAAWPLTFVTGAGPAIIPGQLEAPDVDVSVIEQDTGGCVVSAICVIGSVPERMTLEVLVGDEVLSLGGGEPLPAFPAEPGNIASNACIEVRVREPGGFVSESTRLCGNALTRFELDGDAAAPRSCAAYGPDSEDASSESGGCALIATSAAPGAGGLVLGLAALVAARRRRRAR